MKSENLIAVIGDIHGCINTLKSIYGKIKNVKGEPDVYTVGDLIDRGKFSKEVVQFCIDNEIKSVRGNHEDMLLRAIESSEKLFSFMYKDAELYYYNGGRETQYSYIESKQYSQFKKFRNALKKTGHLDYLKSLPLKFEFDKCVISHAGIIEGGDNVSILWNRKSPAFLNKLQIFGHTPLQEFVYKKNHFTNIDTGCVYKNKLTALIVDTVKGTIETIIEQRFNPDDVD